MNFLYHHRTQGRQVEAVHIRGIVGALRELGHSVDLLEFPGVRACGQPAPPPGTRPAPRRTARLLTRLARHMPPALFTLLELAYNLLTLARVGTRLVRRRPDAIYERYSMFLFATTWLARATGIPIVLEVNDSALVDRVRPLRFAALARRIEGWCFRNAAGLVFISGRFLELAREHHGAIAPAVVSPNAVDSDAFDPARFDRIRLRREAGLDGTVVAGYVGGFVHWHGVRDYVCAIVERMHEEPRLRLLLVGDGVDHGPIRELVAACGLSDRILLPGRLEHDRVAEAIACMDFAVLPDSNDYGSPMKLFEFMAMEVPVLAPDYGPCREVTRDRETGWLFPRGRTDAAVARTLELARMDPAAMREVGSAARRYVSRERRWRDNVAQFLPLCLPTVAVTATGH